MHNKYRRQPPNLQFLGSGLLALATSAVVPRLESFLTGEGPQTVVQVNGLRMLPSAQSHALVLHEGPLAPRLITQMQGRWVPVDGYPVGLARRGVPRDGSVGAWDVAAPTEPGECIR